MKNLKRNPPLIDLTVFVTGAAVLTIEVTATRILSPYFGMTLFTVSSVLSVILAALSFGYWSGGKLVDRYPSLNTLFSTILTGGFFTLVIHVLRNAVLPTWGTAFDMMGGPLVTSLILFFLPSFMLGMVSPIAIRLSAEKLSTVGEVAGNIFFFSTMGSIAGSLATGFILIPHFPVSTIIISTGVILVGMGLIGLVKTTKRTTWLTLAAAGMALHAFARNSTPARQLNLL